MPTDSRELARSVARMNRRLRQERLSELTPSQLSVLTAVVQVGPATPSAIAAHERVQPPSITRTLKCLIDDGFVMREPHPDDGRQVLVSVSKTGRETLEAERHRRDEWLDGQLNQLCSEDRAVLRRAAKLLETMATA